jgi:hypothetical protein
MAQKQHDPGHRDSARVGRDYFTAGNNLKLKVISTGNFVDGVQTHRFARPHVTVSAGE